MALTDIQIRNAKPQNKLYRLTDSQGLLIEIATSGSKLWRYRYRFDGKQKMIGLGKYPSISLQAARKKRDEARLLLDEGIDPGVTGQPRKRSDEPHATSFASLAEEWFTYRAPLWASSTQRKARLYLDNDILPQIGVFSASEITRVQLVDLIRSVEKRGSLNAAGKIRQWLDQIFRYGLVSGKVQSNPATHLSVVAAAAKPVRHHPHIPFDELPELLERLETANIHIYTRSSIKLLLFTAVRPSELRNALWAEFDLDAATWTIPKERMKARREHVVPLPVQAVEVLRQVHVLTGRYKLVFPGQNNPDRPMSENTINKALTLMGYKGRQTGHGFRHLLSTELNSRDFNPDWIERQLAHTDSNAIRDTYNHASYLEQRRMMMQEWVDSVVT